MFAYWSRIPILFQLSLDRVSGCNVTVTHGVDWRIYEFTFFCLFCANAIGKQKSIDKSAEWEFVFAPFDVSIHKWGHIIFIYRTVLLCYAEYCNLMQRRGECWTIYGGQWHVTFTSIYPSKCSELNTDSLEYGYQQLRYVLDDECYFSFVVHVEWRVISRKQRFGRGIVDVFELIWQMPRNSLQHRFQQ